MTALRKHTSGTVLSSASTPPSVPDRNDAPTNGWNSVFAINFNNANKAIIASWDKVSAGAKNISQAASDDPSFNVTGVFQPWQFTVGGDGKNIRMAVTFDSGTYTAGAQTFDMTGAEVTIEVGMEWVPNPDQQAFVISDNTTVNTIKSDLDNNSIDAALKTAFENNGVTLPDTAQSRVIQKGLEWQVKNSAGDTGGGFYIFYSQDKDNDEFLTVYKYQKSWSNNLQVLAKEVSKTQPAVIIITIANNPSSGIPAAVLPQLLSLWFNENIGEFNHVFSSLDLAPQISASDKYSWDKPTATSYAVVDQGSLESSIFGVLTMNQENIPGDNHEVSPYAIPTGTDANGADAGFLISGPDFVKYMMLGGAQLIFDGSQPTDFQITNDHLTVSNTKELVWGKFMMDNKKQGSVSNDNYTGDLDNGQMPGGLSMALQNIGVYPPGQVQVTTKGSQWLLTNGEEGSDEYILDLNGGNIDVYLATIIKIQAGGFKMSLNHTFVEIEFVGLTYPYSSDFNVSINYTEQVVLSLQEKGGKQIFWFDQVLKNMVVSVTKTQSAITREIVEGAVTGALALVAVAGPIIEGLSAGAEIGEVTAEGGDAVVDSEAFANAEAENPQAAAQDSEEAAGQAAARSGGRLTNIKNAFATPKWQFVAKLAALSGAVAGVDATATAIAEAAAKEQWEHVPGFDLFANQVIAPYTFPNVEAFDLTSAWLAGSLQVGLKAKTSSGS